MTLLSSLLVGNTGLQAARAGVHATSHNVSNASTEGFTRRHVEQGVADPLRIGALHYGQGAELYAIGRTTDSLALQRQFQHAGLASSADSFHTSLRQLENVLAVSDGSTPTESLERFFDALNAATADPANHALRQSVSNEGNRFAQAVSATATSIKDAMAGFEQNIEGSLVGVNQSLEDIARLNKAIRAAGGAMGAGDLADKRDLLIRKVAEQVGVTAHIDPDGQATVFVGGHAAVSGDNARTLSLDTSGGGEPTLLLSADASRIDVTDAAGGILGGQLSAWDAANGYLGDLNTFASELATQLNTVHTGGFDRTGTAGADLFTLTPGDEAATLGFSDSILADPDLLAFASGSAGLAGDDGNLRTLIAQEELGFHTGGRTPRQALTRLTAGIGNDVRSAGDFADLQAAVVADLDEAYANLHAVDLDEEAAMLQMYQNAYEAAARVMSTADQMLGTLMELV